MILRANHDKRAQEVGKSWFAGFDVIQIGLNFKKLCIKVLKNTTISITFDVLIVIKKTFLGLQKKNIFNFFF